MTLRALTLWRPWDWAITRIPEDGPVPPKRIENRGWRPPAWLVGQRLAIHGARRWDEAGAERIRSFGLEVPPQSAWPCGISGIVTVDDYVTESDDLWFQGPCGWVLSGVVRVEPVVPCSGRQGLWQVRGPTLSAVLRPSPR